MLLVGIGLFLELPNSEIFCCGCHDVLSLSFHVWDPHNLGWWEFVLNFIYFLEAVIRLFEPQVNDVDLVVHAVSVVASHCHHELVVLAGPESYSVVLEVALVSVDLLSASVFNHDIEIIFEVFGVGLAHELLLASIRIHSWIHVHLLHAGIHMHLIWLLHGHSIWRETVGARGTASVDLHKLLLTVHPHIWHNYVSLHVHLVLTVLLLLLECFQEDLKLLLLLAVKLLLHLELLHVLIRGWLLLLSFAWIQIVEILLLHSWYHILLGTRSVIINLLLHLLSSKLAILLLDVAQLGLAREHLLLVIAHFI